MVRWGRCGRVKRRHRGTGACLFHLNPRLLPHPAVILLRGYRVAVTCVDAFGRESACLRFVEVDVTNGQKIVVTGVPTSGRSDITNFYVYCSLPFGETLYVSRRLDLGLGG